MLFLHNTSRVEDEKYPTLLQDKGFGGFPSLCFMDADGNVLTKPGRSVAAFVETHTKTMELMALRAKGDKATADEQKALFFGELQHDMIAADQVQARADKLTLSDEEKGLLAQKLVDIEVLALLRNARKAGDEVTNEKLAALAKAGKQASGPNTGPFWNKVLTHASQQKDAELAQKAFDALEKLVGQQKGEQVERSKEKWKKMLDEAKAK